MQETATNSAGFPAPSTAAAGQQLPWLPGVSSAPAAAAQGWYPGPGVGGLPPMQQAPAPGQLPSGYEGQLVSHIMAYINNLWRVDPGNFAATLNMICMHAPALMQRLVEHHDSSGAGSGEPGQASGVGGEGPVPAISALQHPQDLEVRVPAFPGAGCTVLLCNLGLQMQQGGCSVLQIIIVMHCSRKDGYARFLRTHE